MEFTRDMLVQLCEKFAERKGTIVTRNDSEHIMITGFNWHKVPMFFYMTDDDDMPEQHTIIKKMGPEVIVRMKLLDTDEDRMELHWISIVKKLRDDSVFIRDIILTAHINEKGEIR